MDAPLYDFVRKYAESDIVRFHTPGHKGKFYDIDRWDITEIEGSDVLYHEVGILEDSQKNASSVFGTGKTLYSTEGSSLCIRAMLALIKIYAVKIGKKPRVAAARNAHKVFMTASAILDIEVDWLYSDDCVGLVGCRITEAELDCYLQRCTEPPVAVYITSPDYLGRLADIKGLSRVCHKYGVLLVVDNAHGAYLKFLPENIHPIYLGADMCCDSAHKTLPVLTGGAYLHISENAPTVLCDNAKKAMATFASTSPSYLILASLDEVNPYLDFRFGEDLAEFTETIEKCKQLIARYGITFINDDPLKLTIEAKPFGYTGDALADIFRANSIECEFSDPDFVVFMLSPCNKTEEIYSLFGVLMALEHKTPKNTSLPTLRPLERRMSVKGALFSPSECIDVDSACGRVLADAGVMCPPAVPVAICGEVLDETAIECFKYYGIEKINVVENEVE